MTAPAGTTPVWLEVHVDDVLLAREPSRWPDAAALLDAVATASEAEGGQISFRVRATFASLDRHGFLVGLEGRGHEIGAHAHGRDLEAGVAALRAAGIQPVVFAPGFVQVGRRGWRRLAERARTLGCRRLTDRVESRLWTYQGWLGWEPIPGVTATDVSVSPFEWGIVVREGERLVAGRPQWERLARLAAIQRSWEPPPGGSAFFGATLHEHNLARPDSLTPDNLDGLRSFIAKFRPVRSGDVPVTVDRVEPGRPTVGDAIRFRARRWALRLHATTRLRVGDHEIEVRRRGPERPAGAVVLVHGGMAGTRQGLAVFGLDEDAFPDLAVWSFARSAGPLTPGNPVHRAETRAVYEHAARDGVPVGFLTWSAGVIPALACGAPAAFLVDGEGPADRFSLVPPGRPDHELAAESVFAEEPWEGREAVRLVRSWAAPYHRLQGTNDHAHGALLLHARRMVAAAPAGNLHLYPGRLHHHGAAIRALVQACFGRPSRPPSA